MVSKKVKAINALSGSGIEIDLNTVTRVEVEKPGFLKVHMGSHYYIVENTDELLPLVKVSVQLSIFDAQEYVEAIKERDKGIATVMESANQYDPLWSKNAEEVFMMYIKKIGPVEFMAEDVRNFASENKLIQDPPSNRAWGGVTQRLARRGVIEKIGMRSVKNPKARMSYANVWKKV
jgi:hypothetical protein